LFPKVYYVTPRAGPGFSLIEKLYLLLEKLNLERKIGSGDTVGIKTHFGTIGNTRYLRPIFIRAIVDFVRKLGAQPLVIETCGHGLGNPFSTRTTATGHLEVAKANGFCPETLNAPIVILDGQYGLDFERVSFNGNYIREVFIPRGLKGIDIVIVATHFKGHGITGFGGAIKNVGVGLIAKPGKGFLHFQRKLEVKWRPDICPTCLKCVKICPSNALRFLNEKIQFVEEKCLLCGMCWSAEVCEHRLIRPVLRDAYKVTRMVVENAKAVIEWLGKDNWVFINFVLDVTPECDCVPWADQIIVPDQGIFASYDPVAVDSASYDFVSAASIIKDSVLGKYDGKITPRDDKFSLVTGVDTARVQLEYAEQIGLGRRTYLLEWVLPDAEAEAIRRGEL